MTTARQATKAAAAKSRLETSGRSGENVVIRPAQWGGIEAVAGIAHDMRAPLATITTSAELLESDLGADDWRQLVGVIHRQAGRLQQMIQDLADYLNLPDRGISLRPEVLDLSELVRDVGAEFQKFKTTHRLTLELPAAAVLVRADGEKLRRVLQNLLGNAFQYAPKGSPVYARLRLPRGNRKQAIIEVEDEGPGVPESARREPFEPFVRLEGTAGSGQGLGLYIVRCLVEAHEGKVWVQPGSTGGARFSVSLPVLPQPQGEVTSLDPD